MQRQLEEIFVNCLEPNDKVSLMQFAKNTKTIFQLVQKSFNFLQLKSSISRIECNSDSPPNINKAIYYAVKQLKANEVMVNGAPKNSKWIVVMTNQAGPSTMVSSDQAFSLL
jgi:hypothetical protein